MNGLELAATECCGGTCVDLDYDSSNCGVCGLACPAGTECLAGSCFQETDCALAQERLACRLSSVAGGICCDGSCVDSTSDVSNCGECGVECAAGTTCAPAQGCVEPDGGRTDFTFPATCGVQDDLNACELDGGADGFCCGGACELGPSLSTCAACGVGCPSCFAGCPAGTTCVSEGNDACVPLGCDGRSNGDVCAYGLVAGGYVSNSESRAICCSASCVDPAQDPDNCGLCGATCPSGICASSAGLDVCFLSEPDQDCLQTCGPLTVCARGSCVDSSCSSSTYCAARDGAVGVCCLAPPYGVAAEAQCSDLANDPLNCGGCGFACPAGQTCTQGACSGTPADCVHRIGGYCNPDGGEGYLCCPGVGCTNVETDNANCGTCGVICSAGTSCQSGSCL